MNFGGEQLTAGGRVEPVPQQNRIHDSLAARSERWEGHRNSRRVSTATCYPPVEAVVRALEILRIVNAQGVATVGGLHAVTNQNKSTIVRMLQTLIEQGYITADEYCGGYRVTDRVQDLSSAYISTSRIIEVTRLHAIEFTRTFKWPLSLGIKDGDALAVHFDTAGISPWVSDANLLRTNPDFYRSAIGRAYCAFCPADELDDIMARLRGDASNPLSAAEEQFYRRTLAVFARRGYAEAHPSDTPPRVNMVAMPMWISGELASVICCSFYRSVISEAAIAERIVQPMCEMIAAIEKDAAAIPAHDGR
jgi:IclR family mhp operon transcriptional activator